MKWCYFKAPFIFDGKMWDVRDSRHWPPRLPAVPAPAFFPGLIQHLTGWLLFGVILGIVLGDVLGLFWGVWGLVGLICGAAERRLIWMGSRRSSQPPPPSVWISAMPTKSRCDVPQKKLEPPPFQCGRWVDGVPKRSRLSSLS